MKILIENYCELKIIKPDISEWKSKLMIYPFEKYYFKTVVSLNKYIFNKYIKWQDFESGLFILNYSKKEIDLILSKLCLKDINDINTLRYYFMFSLKFLTKEKELRANAENCNPVDTGFHKYNFIFLRLDSYFNKDNDKLQQSILTDLSIICNPQEKIFNLKKLAFEYNYPKKKPDLFDNF
jgi:hypothetical protein